MSEVQTCKLIETSSLACKYVLKTLTNMILSTDVLSELPRETGEDEVGVIVCGPESMKQAVASFCKTNGKKKHSGGTKHENLFTFHSINFSL